MGNLIDLYERLFKVFEPMYYLRISTEREGRFYRVVRRDPLIYNKTFDVVVNPNTTTTDVQDTNLEPPAGELYMFMIGLKNNVRVRVKQPTATARFGVVASVGEITYDLSPSDNPNPMTTMATIKGANVTFSFYNPTDVPLKPEIRFLGMKYKLMEITDARTLEELHKKYLEGSVPEITLLY